VGGAWGGLKSDPPSDPPQLKPRILLSNRRSGEDGEDFPFYMCERDLGLAAGAPPGAISWGPGVGKILPILPMCFQVMGMIQNRGGRIVGEDRFSILPILPHDPLNRAKRRQLINAEYNSWRGNQFNAPLKHLKRWSPARVLNNRDSLVQGPGLHCKARLL
jgi:hypothetical protein